MKRFVGFLGLAVSGFSFIAVAVMGTYFYKTSLFFMLLFLAGGITAAACLNADAIRFVGKCFSQGFNAGNSQECSQVCPLCGKTISGDAHFCSECGCELTKKSQ